MSEYFSSLVSVIIPLCAPNLLQLLDSRSIEYLRRTRGGNFIPEPLTKDDKVQLLRKAQQPFENLAHFLELNNGIGPFILGSQVSFVDFSIGGLLDFIQKTEKDLFEEVLSWSDGKWGIYCEGIQQIERCSSDVVMDE
ncbi:hypothetical protein ACGC1H_006325 [Rhizoctonia solani]